MTHAQLRRAAFAQGMSVAPLTAWRASSVRSAHAAVPSRCCTALVKAWVTLTTAASCDPVLQAAVESMIPAAAVTAFALLVENMVETLATAAASGSPAPLEICTRAETKSQLVAARSMSATEPRRESTAAATPSRRVMGSSQMRV